MNLKKDNAKIQLGDRVRDQISGFEGIVISITDFIAGCRRIGVAPEGLEKGELRESEIFDEANLELIKKSIYKTSIPHVTSVRLGDRVRDKISSFEGIVTSITKYLANSLYVGISPTVLKDGKVIQTTSFPANGVELIENQIHKAPTKHPGGDQKIPNRYY